jgi:hypothetical protein
LLHVSAWASLPAGSWKFERSVDYFGRAPASQAPKFATMKVSGDHVTLSDTCVVRLTTEDYFFSDVFQPLSKQGVTAEQVNAFLLKHFKLSLAKTKSVHSLGPTTKCKPPMLELFLVNDKILVPVGVTFYLYARAVPNAPTGAPAGAR